ncbi:MAG TPA: phosphatidylglycerophosphatase A [Gammaproteobacteria bacterium]|nr:phosphatidylglycerophosphatase A [Gammaproteobacteria bacterium]
MSEKNRKICISELKDPLVFIAMGLGSGLSPIAPGTAGTLLTVPLVYFLQQQTLLLYLLVTFFVLATGSWLCAHAAKKLGVHDHSGIVYDEVAGFLITMSIAPHGWLWLLAGFALFRFFDAVKPWPISWFDKNVHGGFGIMFDDVIAGIFSLSCLLLIQQFIPVS